MSTLKYNVKDGLCSLLNLFQWLLLWTFVRFLQVFGACCLLSMIFLTGRSWRDKETISYNGLKSFTSGFQSHCLGFTPLPPLLISLYSKILRFVRCTGLVSSRLVVAIETFFYKKPGRTRRRKTPTATILRTSV